MGQIERLLERPKLYNNIDGVGELGMGAMLLGFGLLTWLQVHSLAGSLWHKVYVVLPLILLMAWALDRGMKAIKRRITYPRTGYVEYKDRDTRRTALIAFFASALVAMLLLLIARSHWSLGPRLDLTAPAALLGLAFAAAYAYGLARVARWKWAVAGVIAVCSVAIATLPAGWTDAIVGNPANTGPFSLNNAAGWVLSMLVYAAILLLSGAISFWLYLRHTQPPPAEAE